MGCDRSHRRRFLLFMQRKDYAAADDSEEQEKGRDVIKFVCRANEYFCEQYYCTGQRQTCMREAKTGRALALTQTEDNQVNADRYGCDK
jgi:hypothetical protein